MSIWAEVVCNKCAKTVNGTHVSAGVPFVQDLRRNAKKYGWTQIGYRDYCPCCSGNHKIINGYCCHCFGTNTTPKYELDKKCKKPGDV